VLLLAITDAGEFLPAVLALRRGHSKALAAFLLPSLGVNAFSSSVVKSPTCMKVSSFEGLLIILGCLTLQPFDLRSFVQNATVDGFGLLCEFVPAKAAIEVFIGIID